ncbi:flagellar hook-basal body complex protein FliE [Hydrogenophaga aquatica]
MSSQMLVQIQASLAQMQASIEPVVAPSAADPGPAMSFAEHMGAMVRSVDDQGKQASDRMAAVERGESDDLVGAMLSSQQASLSFSMLMQVRNKVVGAVDELIKLQL